MRCFPWVVLAAAVSGAAAQEADSNVNSRYIIESVEVSGYPEARLSQGLRLRLYELIGQRFSEPKVRDLVRRMREELPGARVTEKIVRGTQLEHLKIIFEVTRRKHRHFDLSVPRALYHSRQGWSGELNATVRIATSSVAFGIVSNEDPLVERFAGVTAGYENRRIGTDMVRLAFLFESYHQQWDPATRAALEREPAIAGVYRWRQNFQPQLTLAPARGLRLSFGASFQRLQTQFPAARTEAANAAIATLRYDRSLESSGSTVHRFETGYTLRAAARALDSDFVYARQQADFRYTLSRRRNRLTVDFVAGLMNGRAPLFERFVLGNSRTLRGWNKYDVAPLGGDRVAHNTVEYGYRGFRVFYDAGAVWSRGQEAEAKHSLGVGFRSGEYFLALAFPVKAGRANPIFMTGLSF